MTKPSARPDDDDAPLTREALLAWLGAMGIETSTVEHPPLHTVEESRALRGTIPGGHCKNLFLKDKAGAYWLVVTLEDAAVDLKRLPAVIGSGRLSFARAERLMEVLGVEPGSVTPFAAANDTTGRVTIVLDEAMMRHERLNYHPLTNIATTTIARDDLVRFLQATGHEPVVADASGSG